MENIIVDVKRGVSYFGVLMPIRVLVDGIEVTRIKSGSSYQLELPVKKTNLTFSMVGNDFSKKWITVVTINPEQCKKGYISCELTAKAKGFFGLQIIADIKYF